MSQKLSAMRYIKNNKRRTAVLIVSLGLCFVLTYLTQFLLSSTVESFRPILLENTKKIQYIFLTTETLGVEDEMDRIVEEMPDIDEEQYTEKLFSLYYEKKLALVDKLKQHDGVKEVYICGLIYGRISPAVGNLTYEIPLVSKEQTSELCTYMNAKLMEGRMPENPGEIVLDEATMKNNHYELNGYFDEDFYQTDYKIVGVLDCETYFGCGIPIVDTSYYSMIAVLSEGIDDISAELVKEGLELRENEDTVFDYKWGEEFMKVEVSDVIGNSTVFIYIGIIILLSISLLVVYTMYLRDRYNEWCLYCSIGYSRKTIYFSILRELLFTFVAALLAGGIIIVITVVALDKLMIEPLGLKCNYFYPETLLEIFCSYILIFGILQIPVRAALYKIRTIDAIEDDLY